MPPSATSCLPSNDQGGQPSNSPRQFPSHPDVYYQGLLWHIIIGQSAIYELVETAVWCEVVGILRGALVRKTGTFGMDLSSSDVAQWIQQGHDIQSFKSFFVAVLTILWFEYFSTFDKERRFMWGKKKNWLFYLFTFNRYYTLVAFMIASFMFFSPAISQKECSRLVLFLPFGVGISTQILSNVLLGARVAGLYGRSRAIIAFFLVYLLAQTAVILWTFLERGGGPIPLPQNTHLDAFQACIDLASSHLGYRAGVWLCLECFFDILIIGMTIAKSWGVLSELNKIQNLFGQSKASVLDTLVRDGAIYFLVIFTFNMTWLMMIIFAPPGLKWICALPAQAMTVVLVSRITLNLRAEVQSTTVSGNEFRRSPRLNQTVPQLQSMEFELHKLDVLHLTRPDEPFLLP